MRVIFEKNKLVSVGCTEEERLAEVVGFRAGFLLAY